MQNVNPLATPSRLRAIIIVILAAVALGAWLMMQSLNDEKNRAGTALIGGPFTMLNQKGETVTEKNFLGHYTLYFFGFTNCGDVCPAELQVMTAALNELGADAEKITPVFVSVDPERDTPAVMAAYVANYDARMQGLTGSAEQVAGIAKAFHVFYQKIPNPKDPKDYEMDHSSILFAMAPDGTFAKHFNYTTDAVALAADLKKLIEH